MNPKLEKLLYLAEEQYLQSEQLGRYETFLAKLAEKIKVYEILREQEIFIFKILTDELQEEYPEEGSVILGETLSQWSLILRYCSMAMILDNPDYLSNRLEHWMKEQIQMRERPEMDTLIYDTLLEVMPEILLDPQVALIKPYLVQAHSAIGIGEKSKPLLALG